MSKDYIEINFSNLLTEAKKNQKKRQVNPNYEKIRLALSNPKIKPSEIKISQSSKRKFFNRVSSIKKSNVLSSIIKSKISKKSKNKKKYDIHQLVPILAPRDAVGNEVLTIRDALRK